MFGAAMLTAGLASSIGAAGLQIGIQRHVARRGDRRRLRLALTVNIALAICAGGVLLAFSERIAARMGLSSGGNSLFALIACLTVVQVVLAGQTGVVAGASAFRALASQGVLLSAATLACGVPLAWYAGVNGALLATCAATFVVLLRVSMVASHLAPPPSVDGESPFRLLLGGIPVVMADVAGQIAVWWLIVQLGTNGGTSELGYFRTAQTVSGLILVVPGAINPAMFSHFAGASSVPERFREVTAQTARTVWMMTLPIVAAVALWRTPLLALLFGPKFLLAANATGVMVWWALLLAVYGVLWQALIGHGRSSASAAVGISCLAGTVLVTRFMPGSNALGTALSLLTIQGFLTVVLAGYVAIRLGVRYQRLIGLLGLTTVVAVATFVVGAETSLARGAAGTLVVAACIAIQWCLIATPTERASVRGLIAQASMTVRRIMAERGRRSPTSGSPARSQAVHVNGPMTRG